MFGGGESGRSLPKGLIEEQQKAKKWKARWAAYGLVVWVGGTLMLPAVFYAAERTFSREVVEVLWAYTTGLGVNPAKAYWDMLVSPRSHVGLDQGLMATIGCMLAGFFLTLSGWKRCPYRDYPMIHGDARFANEQDLEGMNAGDQIGPKGKFLHFGTAFGKKLALIETLSVSIFAPPGTGKCVSVMAPLCTGTGKVIRAGEVRVGDGLMGPDGKPRKVTNVVHFTEPRRYRVTAKLNSESWECNGDHRMVLYRGYRKEYKDERRRPTVREWMAWPKSRKTAYKTLRQVADYTPEPRLGDLDPWLYGAWLGDGSFGKNGAVSWTTADLKDVLLGYGEALGETWSTRADKRTLGDERQTTWAILPGTRSSVTRALQEMGHRGSNAGTKRVHPDYKYGSREVRELVLGGLVDSDGHYEKENKLYSVTSKSKGLAEDIQEMCHSIGLAARLKEVHKRATNATTEQGKKGGTYYTVTISGDLRRIKVWSDRKRATARNQIKNVRMLGLEVDAVGHGDLVTWETKKEGEEEFGVLDWQYLCLLDGCEADHEVLAADGRKIRAGEIQEGMLMKGAGGRSIEITAVRKSKGTQARIVGAKGDRVSLGMDHRLDLALSKHGGNKEDEVEVTLKEWLKWPYKRQRDYRLKRTPINFPDMEATDASLPVDSYVMGMLQYAGDRIGGKHGILVSRQNGQADAVAKALGADEKGRKGGRTRRKLKGKSNLDWIELNDQEQERLEGCGWNPQGGEDDGFGNRKRCEGQERPAIPEAYRRASKATRQAVLAGALDLTAGEPGGKNATGLTVKTGQGDGRDDIKWIARTLGFSAGNARSKRRGGWYEEKVSLQGDFTSLGCKLADKDLLKARSTQNPYHLYSEMQAECIEEESWFAGITLEGDGRFLLGDTTITHNTTRMVIPGILATDDACMVVNDPKPELWPIVSGWRASLGQAYRLDWGKEDDPETGVFHPKFNFIAKALVPPAGGKRDNFVDALAKVLIPAKDGGGDNSYFVNQGRAALVGFTQYLLYAINDRVEDTERYDELPERWLGKEASFPMLVDWLVETELKASENEGEDSEDDPMRSYLKSVVHKAKHGRFPQPCIVNLQPLVNMADKERSGVLGSMQEALMSFRNTSVVERTEDTDFLPADLGGRIKEDVLAAHGYAPGTYPYSEKEWNDLIPKLRDSDWETVDVFVCVNQAEAQAFEVLTALFLDVVVRFLISYGPGERTANGAIMGPFPTCFMMDELVKMARCDAVVAGPDLGRSKKRFFVLIAQAMAQIEQRYSKQQRDIIMTSCAATVALPQNDPQTIDEIAKKSGDTTVKRESVSYQRNAKPWSGNVSTNLEKVRLLHVGNIGKMPAGEHILIVQDWNARPVQCKSCLYFREDEMLKKAWNPRQRDPAKNGVPEAKPLPDSVHARRLLEWNRKEEEKRKAKEEAERNAAFEEWRYHIDLKAMVNTPAAGP